MKPSTRSVRIAVLVAVITGSVITGLGAVTQPARASLSTATADNVVAGLSNASQPVYVTGQATGNGETNYYRIDVSDILRTGAEVQEVTFVNLGSDQDALDANSQIRYLPDAQAIEFAVTEDSADPDKKVEFAVKVTLDTTDAIATDELRYTVVQFATERMDNKLSPQSAQFTLIGTNVLSATTESDSAGIFPVTHRGELTMPRRERGITHLSINTSGANYGALTHEDIVVRVNGGVDLVTTPGAVSGTAGGLMIQLDSVTTFYQQDEVTITLRNATNPPSTSQMTVALRTRPTEPVFASSDELQVDVECLQTGDVVERRAGWSRPSFETYGAVGAGMLVAGALAVRYLRR